MSISNIALKIGPLVFGLVIFLFLFKRVKGLKKFGVQGLIYVLSISLILALPILFLFIQSSKETFLLIFSQLAIIVISILHLVYSKKIIPWMAECKFDVQLIFILCILLFAYFFSNLFFTFFVKSYVRLVWQLSLLWFLVPILLNQTVNKFLEVPQKEFKKWQYPLNVTINDPSDEEMASPVVISFMVQKNNKNSELTTFRAKAPVGMSLGRLFYFFINDYNSRHPEAMITYVSDSNEPEFWIFYKLRNKFLQWKKALDPEDSIYNCNIKENDVLICDRFNINKKDT